MKTRKWMLTMMAVAGLAVFTGCSGKTMDHKKGDSMQKQDMMKDDMKKDDMKKDDMMKDDMKHDDMKKDDMKKDGMKHDDMKGHTMMNEGEAAPDFTLTGLDGKTYRLADLKGKKVYLKFWASWCSICLSTLQDTDELAANAGDDYVVLSVVAPKVNGEKSEEDFKKWFSTLEYKNLPVAFDQDGKTLEAYGVRSYPSAAFIGSDGVLVKKHIGFMSADEVKETLKQVK